MDLLQFCVADLLTDQARPDPTRPMDCIPSFLREV